MQTLEELKGRIDNATDMQSVVSAMKVLAVVGIRQFERALMSLDEFDRTVELGLQISLKHLPKNYTTCRPKPGKRLLAMVLGSEQGLSGQFNEQIVAYALERLDEIERSGDARDSAASRTVIALGEHVTYRLQGAGAKYETMIPMPGSIRAVSIVSRDLLSLIDSMKRDRGIDQVLLFYHKPITGSSYRPFMLRLFPVSDSWLNRVLDRPWPSRNLPVFQMDWKRLFTGLIQQHYRLSLERSFVRSLLAENASRLLSMQVAENNIAEYLDDLSHRFNNQRQTAITSEILDIVASSQALSGGELGYEYQDPADDEYGYYRFDPG